MPLDGVSHEATQFVAKCYECASIEIVYSTRYELWIGKPSKRKNDWRDKA